MFIHFHDCSVAQWVSLIFHKSKSYLKIIFASMSDIVSLIFHKSKSDLIIISAIMTARRVQGVIWVDSVPLLHDEFYLEK